jgi:DNA-binding response OmpR family regulator
MQFATGAKVLVVSQDASERRLISDALMLQEDLIAIEADTSQSALSLLQEHTLKSVLIDADLPDIDGHDLCRLMRRQGVKIPIILLGARMADADIILGLDSGASDYVVKPFRTNVLLARLRAQHRHFEQLDDAVFPIGPYSFRPSTKILTSKDTDKKIHLTAKEAAILKCLYRLGGRAAEPATLMGEIWGERADVTPHALETHIYRLRQKLEPDPCNVRLLVTDPEGYRLVR